MPADRHVLACPECTRKLAVRAAPGSTVQVNCPDCSSSFRWRAAGFVEAQSAPPPNDEMAPAPRSLPSEDATPPAGTDPARGWSAGTHVIAAMAILALLAAAPSLFGNALQGNDAALAIGLLLVLLSVYHIYRAMSLLTGFGLLVGIGVTLVVVTLIGMVPDLLKTAGLGDIMPGGEQETQAGSFELPENLGVEDLPPTTETSQESHFQGVTAENTSVSELDDLMEDW